MTTAEQSSSPTVRRHATAFRRTWPGPPAPAVVTPPSLKTAVEVGIGDLGDGRSKRVQVAKAAEKAGWTWTAHFAHSPTDEGATSVVMRLRLPGAFPWACRRAVAYWRSPRPDRPLALVGSYGWRDHGGGLRTDLVAIEGKALVAWVRARGEPPEEVPTPATGDGR